VPQLVEDAGPVGPVRGLRVYPGGDDNLHRACNVVSLLSDMSAGRLGASKLSADLHKLISIGKMHTIRTAAELKQKLLSKAYCKTRTQSIEST